MAVGPGIAGAQTDAGTYRAASELNIRAAPSIGAELLGVIPPGGLVAVSACDAFGWCEVRYEAIDGWAARQFLVRTGDLPPDAFVLRFGAPTAPVAEIGAIVEVTGNIEPRAPCATLETDAGETFAIVGNVVFDPAQTLLVLAETIAGDACGTDAALAILHVRIDR